MIKLILFRQFLYSWMVICHLHLLFRFSNLFPGNSRVMKLLWCGKCYSICTFSTPQTGTTAAQCLPSYSFMVLFSLQSIHLSISALASRCIMESCVSSAFPECTSITFTQKMLLLSGLQSFMWQPFSQVACVGSAIIFSARRYLVGPLIHRGMPCGMSSWVSILTLQTPS